MISTHPISSARCFRFFFFTRFFSTLLFLMLPAIGPAQSSLPRSTPEREGASSRGILRWIDEMDRSGMEFHSVMVVRHGKVIAEGWWKPYAPELRHSMYSVSKSFTAAAVGFAVGEHRMSVDDPVLSFFPEYAPDSVSENLSQLRVKHLLSMSVGQRGADLAFPGLSDTNWIALFFSRPIMRKPGTAFLYNSNGSYMLSAIVQKVTGQPVVEYLRPRLFEPLGISDPKWEVDPKGINAGGWGLRLRTEEMAKFGLLYLRNGVWDGRQIMPKEWIDEATSMKILQSPDMPKEARDTSDWQQGYCYQMWRSLHNAYRADGAFGQLIVMIPEADAVVAVTAETTNMQAELNLVWNYLLPALASDSVSSNPGDNAALRKKLASLSILPPASISPTGPTPRISGKTFALKPNTLMLHRMSFAFTQGDLRVSMDADSSVYPFTFGKGTWIEGMTRKPGPNLVHASGDNAFLLPTRVVCSYRWKDRRTLELTLRYIETPHTETLLCTFDGPAVTVSVENSLDRGKTKTVIAGTLVR